LPGYLPRIIISSFFSVSSDNGKRKKTVLKQDGVTVDLSSQEGHGKIHAGVLDDQFVLSADKVAELQEKFGMTIDELLIAMITPASAMARPPISSFHVGYVVHALWDCCHDLQSNIYYYIECILFDLWTSARLLFSAGLLELVVVGTCMSGVTWNLQTCLCTMQFMPSNSCL